MRKYFGIISGIILIAVTLVLFLIFANKDDSKKNIENQNIISNNINEENNKLDENTTKEIENMKNQINSTADTNIYQIEEEPNGRKFLQIKRGIQFEVALAGIVKNDKPEEKELEELIKKVPTNTGIWISEQSREQFINLLNRNNINNFNITHEGYLVVNKQTENSISKKFENMINNEKLYIINMTGNSYQRDYISGQIEEYPFEDMDPTQIIEPYIYETNIILEVTSNKKEKLTDKEILEAIVQY